jgi:uncharacterized protein (UPF0332 family)
VIDLLVAEAGFAFISGNNSKVIKKAEKLKKEANDPFNSEQIRKVCAAKWYAITKYWIKK